MRDGDRVSLTSSPIPAMSNEWQTRILRVARAIPPRHYIVYRQLAELAGVANSYCRAFPKVLARLPAEIGGRVLSASAVTSERLWDGVDLFDTTTLLMQTEKWGRELNGIECRSEQSRSASDGLNVIG